MSDDNTDYTAGFTPEFIEVLESIGLKTAFVAFENARRGSTKTVGFVRGLRAALAAGKDASPLAGSIGGGGVPPGWQLMPEVHTDAMVDAFENAMEGANSYVRNFTAAYKAMRAAPTHGIRALPGPDSQQPHVALPRDGGTDKLGGC